MAQPFNKPPRVKSSVPGSFTKNRVPRDAERTPSVKDIEESIRKGTSRSLAEFRKEIRWKK